MVPQLQNFIENNIDLIEDNNWFKLYGLAVEQIPFQIGNMSTTLLDAGINPLHYVKRMPPHMFSNSRITEFIIPDEVENISHLCFYACYELKKVTIPKSIKTIYETAFTQCYELKDIIYGGTVQEMSELNPHASLLKDCVTTYIKCSNGTYDVATGEVIL